MKDHGSREQKHTSIRIPSIEIKVRACNATEMEYSMCKGYISLSDLCPGE